MRVKDECIESCICGINNSLISIKEIRTLNYLIILTQGESEITSWNLASKYRFINLDYYKQSNEEIDEFIETVSI